MRKQTHQRGVVLLVALFVIVVLIIIGSTLCAVATSDARVAAGHRNYLQAFQLAEAGLERILYDLRQDYVEATSVPSWIDGDIHGLACGPNAEEYVLVPYAEPELGHGTYAVHLRNVPGRDDAVWVQSVGSVGQTDVGVEALVQMHDLSVWSNAIFAGFGSGTAVIRGNSTIAGPVHILGDNVGSGECALRLGGGASIVNDYTKLPPALRAKIPPCPRCEHRGEVVESLGATVRARRGMVGLDGASALGASDQPGNDVKETTDGVFVTDGFTGTSGEDNVFSDNGVATPYDMADKLSFPSITEPYRDYPTYLEYLREKALVITDAAQLEQLANLTPEAKFEFSDADGKGLIAMDGQGNLKIAGIVYVPGSVAFTSTDGKILSYRGRGSLVCEGDVRFRASLVTEGDRSFPYNIIGVMTPGSIVFDGANIDVMGVFYGQKQIVNAKQTDVVGSLVSHYVDMGSQVPSVYYVPLVRKMPPPGLIDAGDYAVQVMARRQFRPLGSAPAEDTARLPVRSVQ
jgi:hypothetical protein